MLVLSLLALLAGPVLYALFLRLPQSYAALDGFVSIAMGGLVLLGILPDIVANGGWPTLLFGVVGFFGPSLLEHRSHALGRGAHRVALALGMSALAIHAAMDGVALVGDATHGVHLSHDHESDLPLAVVLHRLPVALAVWWLVSRNFGRGAAAATLVGIGLSTIAGAALGEEWIARLEARHVAWFQALVTGSLLHVVFHRMHRANEHGKNRGGLCPDAACPPGGEPAAAGSGFFRVSWAGAGGLAGIVLLVLVAVSGDSHLAHLAESRFAETFLRLSLESAPALLLGYFLAGLMAEFLPGASIRWLRGGGSFRQACRGVALGLPIPVCSCGVVPLYRSLVLRSAPVSAAIAFLVATPELGVDAFLLSIPLLGWRFTLLRVGAAAIVALVVAMIVARFTADPGPADVDPAEKDASKDPWLRRARRAAGIGFGEVADRTGPWILVGLLVAAFVEPLLETSFVQSLPGALEVIAFTLIGIPMYICASGATPLAAVFLQSGISPGAVLAFLLTGPATNVTTFGMLKALHGRRSALAFTISIVALTTALGFIVNAFGGVAVPQGSPEHVHGPVSWLRSASLVALLILFVLSILRRGPRVFFGEIFRFPAPPLAKGSAAAQRLDASSPAPCCAPSPVPLGAASCCESACAEADSSHSHP